MKNRIVIALLIGVSAASVCAFDGYDADYSYKALQKARAEKRAEQKQAVEQHVEQHLDILKRASADQEVDRQIARRLATRSRHHDGVLENGEMWMIPITVPSSTRYYQEKLAALDDKLFDLYKQINDLDKQYQAQLYGLPGYERSLTGEITSPRQTARSAAKGFRGWFARKWYR